MRYAIMGKTKTGEIKNLFKDGRTFASKAYANKRRWYFQEHVADELEVVAVQEDWESATEAVKHSYQEGAKDMKDLILEKLCLKVENKGPVYYPIEKCIALIRKTELTEIKK